MKLHESGEDYLEAIFVLQKKKGMVRSVDVAQHLGVKKPSVCNAVSILEQGSFLVKDEDHFLHLTEKGRETAEAIYERHCYLKLADRGRCGGCYCRTGSLQDRA